MIVTPGTLGWRAGQVDTMAAQIDHLVQMSRRPNLRVGVIPRGAQATVFPPDGFNLYDERLVIVGTTTATAHVTDARDVARYVTLLAALEAMAVFVGAARALLTEAAVAYSSHDVALDDQSVGEAPSYTEP